MSTKKAASGNNKYFEKIFPVNLTVVIIKIDCLAFEENLKLCWQYWCSLKLLIISSPSSQNKIPEAAACSTKKTE